MPRVMDTSAARFLLAKHETGELDSGYLADGFVALLEVAAREDSERRDMILSDPFAWLCGFYGYGSEFMNWQDNQTNYPG
jgi:hypothetical protein